jgi:hypothetical protein
MNDNAFYPCKLFIEQRIIDQPDNVELVKAYISLIEHKTIFDIAFCTQTAEVQKNLNDNHMEMNRKFQESQTEIIKRQIDCGIPRSF